DKATQVDGARRTGQSISLTSIVEHPDGHVKGNSGLLPESEEAIPRHTVVALVGPTCVGKSSVAILMAQYLDTEIISADSMQVYKGMDIGTAKPDAEQQRAVKHHMIDVVEPWEDYSTGRYLSDAVSVIDDLHKRSRIPLVVGGTGLYLRAMTRGLVDAPQADWQLRDRLTAIESKRPGWLMRYLRRIDPVSCGRIDPHDTRRIVRAVEVFLKTGSPMSAIQHTSTRPLPHRFIKLGLTRNRQELYAMIQHRVDEMLRSGLLQEVRALAQLALARTPLQAIGYKELLACFRGEMTLDMAVGEIKKATKRYAKRQFTWFNAEDNITWIDISGISNSQDIFEKIKHILNKNCK
ncbi:MAG: tRNA (adenosine(37)-N6)-dimethylallyltransferase MiaA, partial [Candidatus Magnetobacterium sp. LHC-1]